MAKQEIKLIANNKKAHHDYFLEEKYEAGVELHGTEVKSLRMGKCSIKEAFVRIEKGEVIIYGMHISPQTCRQDCRAGLYACPGGSLFQGKPCESTDCSCKR